MLHSTRKFQAQPKTLKTKISMIQKPCVTDRQGQQNRFSGFKFDAQFYLRTCNNFENKLFLQLSATIPTFNNNMFLKILRNFIFTQYLQVASARDEWTVTGGQKSK